MDGDSIETLIEKDDFIEQLLKDYARWWSEEIRLTKELSELNALRGVIEKIPNAFSNIPQSIEQSTVQLENAMARKALYRRAIDLWQINRSDEELYAIILNLCDSSPIGGFVGKIC